MHACGSGELVNPLTHISLTRISRPKAATNYKNKPNWSPAVAWPKPKSQRGAEMGRGRKVKMGRRQTLKIGRRQKRRWRKVEKGRRIKNGPKDIQERHDLLMAKYIETRSKSEVILCNLSSTDEICFFFWFISCMYVWIRIVPPLVDFWGIFALRVSMLVQHRSRLTHWQHTTVVMVIVIVVVSLPSFMRGWAFIVTAYSRF